MLVGKVVHIRFGLDVLDYGELSVPSENFLKCKQVSGIS